MSKGDGIDGRARRGVRYAGRLEARLWILTHCTRTAAPSTCLPGLLSSARTLGSDLQLAVFGPCWELPCVGGDIQPETTAELPASSSSSAQDNPLRQKFVLFRPRRLDFGPRRGIRLAASLTVLM